MTSLSEANPPLGRLIIGISFIESSEANVDAVLGIEGIESRNIRSKRSFEACSSAYVVSSRHEFTEVPVN